MLTLMKTNIRTHNKNSSYRQKYVVFIVKNGFVLSFPVRFLTKFSIRKGNPHEGKKNDTDIYMHFTYL